jgi:hypothetical protein
MVNINAGIPGCMGAPTSEVKLTGLVVCYNRIYILIWQSAMFANPIFVAGAPA